MTWPESFLGQGNLINLLPTNVSYLKSIWQVGDGNLISFYNNN